MGISRHNRPYRTISEPTVNQRALGSSPRGGALIDKGLQEIVSLLRFLISTAFLSIEFLFNPHYSRVFVMKSQNTNRNLTKWFTNSFKKNKKS